ncbi:hypothetical protein [Pseudomonas sp. LB1P83]
MANKADADGKTRNASSITAEQVLNAVACYNSKLRAYQAMSLYSIADFPCVTHA